MSPVEGVALVAGSLLLIALIGAWIPWQRMKLAAQRRAEQAQEQDAILLIVVQDIGATADDLEFAWPHGGRLN